MATRVIRGDTDPIFPPVLTAQAVAWGDLVALSSGNVVRAEDTSWGTAVATPTAPTVANGSTAVGSELTNALTGVKISYQFPWGEGTVSAAATTTPTAASTIKVSGASLVPATNALWTNVYVESAAGSGTYGLWGRTYGEDVYVNSYGLGAAPYAGNAGGVVALSGATQVTQYAFAQAFAGRAAQTKVAATARVYGNSTDNVIRVDAAGIYEYPCASATFAVGDLVGAAKASGNALESQKVVAVAHQALAVGVVAEAGTSVTAVKVKLLPKMTPAARAA
jgi:hypothetical protein